MRRPHPGHHLPRHALLVVNVAFVGAMVGAERTVVPLLAEQVFEVRSRALVLAFIAGFGAAKAGANAASGWLADHVGRRRVLIAGWLLAPVVPVALALAPTWGWVVAANVVLGVQQGLTWTMTLTMMGDLAGRRRRGLAMGVNESVGYLAIAGATWASGELAAAAGLRAAPFVLGAVAAVFGIVTAVRARDTFAEVVGDAPASAPVHGGPAHRWACNTAGLTTKAVDAGMWGLLPVMLAERGLAVATVGRIAAIYPLAWGVGQLLTGAWSDAVGRRLPIAGGMAAQAAGLALIAGVPTTAGAALGAGVLGLGTALAYPTLLAAVQDAAAADRRGRAMGSYRFYRDAGFVVGALGLGAVADLADIPSAVTVAALAAVGAAAVTAVAVRDPAAEHAAVPSDAVT